jgi:dipeptidyl-peptidase-3
VYKSTGDYEAGSEMFMRYSEVNDHDAPHFLSLRSIVLARKQPRKMFVQSNTQLNGERLK